MRELHQDKDYFLAAVNHTAALTGFSHALIEKDYYLSLFLERLYANPVDLIFKGGSCLNKIHVGFYRLSEDLDFMIDWPSGGRDARRKAANKLKKIFDELINNPFENAEEIQGFNESKQYNGSISYNSILGGKGSIKIEVSIREALFFDRVAKKGMCLLQDAFSLQTITVENRISAYSLKEAFAEKIRAMFTRKEIAIRDTYDIYYALSNQIITLSEELLDAAREKILIEEGAVLHDPEDILSVLKAKSNGELKPVLRKKDYDSFDLSKAKKIVEEVYAGLAGLKS